MMSPHLWDTSETDGISKWQWPLTILPRTRIRFSQILYTTSEGAVSINIKRQSRRLEGSSNVTILIKNLLSTALVVFPTLCRSATIPVFASHWTEMKVILKFKASIKLLRPTETLSVKSSCLDQHTSNNLFRELLPPLSNKYQKIKEHTMFW